jgi:hypothetical protein
VYIYILINKFKWNGKCTQVMQSCEHELVRSASWQLLTRPLLVWYVLVAVVFIRL